MDDDYIVGAKILNLELKSMSQKNIGTMTICSPQPMTAIAFIKKTRNAKQAKGKATKVLSDLEVLKESNLNKQAGQKILKLQ